MKRNPRFVATAGALALALALVLGACGGNGDPGARGSSDGGSASPSLTDDDALKAFAGCMRDNDVPNYPDPEGGLIIDNARDLDADPAAFEAAWEACESLLPAAPARRRRTPPATTRRAAHRCRRRAPAGG